MVDVQESGRRRRAVLCGLLRLRCSTCRSIECRLTSSSVQAANHPHCLAGWSRYIHSPKIPLTDRNRPELGSVRWSGHGWFLLCSRLRPAGAKLNHFLDFDRLSSHPSLGCFNDPPQSVQRLHRLPILFWILWWCDWCPRPPDPGRPFLLAPERSCLHCIPLVLELW